MSDSSNTIKGNRNANTLNGTSRDDLIYGYEGNDTLNGGAGNDLLDGGTGADRMAGGTGNDIYVVADLGDVVIENANEGTDTVQASISYALTANVEALTLTGTAAINGTGNALNNTLRGNAAANVLDGGAGADTLIGGAGNDTYVVDSAADAVTENANEGSDTVQASVSWTLGANLENLTLTGAALNGTGNTLNNTLAGNGLDNTLDGGAGNDTLDGRGGNDVLRGGAGSDAYLFGAGSGRELIVEAANGSDIDTVRIAAGIAPGTVSLIRADNDLIVRLASGDELRVQGQYSGTGIEQIQFADGTLWGAAQIANAASPVTGTAGNDVLAGNAWADQIDGKGGDDILAGGAGGDVYRIAAGDGRDVINETVNDSEVDTLGLAAGIDASQVSLARVGADLLVRIGSGQEVRVAGQFAGTGIEKIAFADGSAWGAAEFNNATWEIAGTAGNDYLNGHDGADLIQGTAGDDMLIGGMGSDTYVVAAGDGRDTIREELAAGDVDTLRFADGIPASQVSLARVGADLLVRVAGGQEVRVAGQFAGTGIEKIAFADGSAWGAAEFNNATWEIAGTAGNDYLNGHDGADLIQGAAGDDMLIGGTGSDTYVYAAGDGRDTIREELAAGDVDTLRFGAGIGPNQVTLAHVGEDLLVRLADGSELRVAGQFAGYGIEKIAFADGTVWGSAEINHAGLEMVGTESADYLPGSDGNDLFRGMAGDDMLMGGVGSDTYEFAAGDGQDTIREENDASAIDAIRFLSNVAPDQVSLERMGNDLLVNLSTGDQLRVVGQYSGSGIEQIQFADGSSWGAKELNSAPMDVFGSAGNDVLAGHEGVDFIRGYQGDDMLMGVTGSDTYLYASGDGNDTIREEASAGDINTLRFDAGITASQVSLARIGSDLLVRMADGAELRVAGQFAGYGIEKIAFADGSAWGEAEINNASWEITGSAGSDVLAGHEGADLLRGGAGDDMLMGVTGSDTYLYASGDGNDTIREEASAGDIDTLRFDVGITASQVNLVRMGSDLLVRMADGAELRVAGQFAGYGIEKIAFADGTAWGEAEINNASWEITGSAGSDVLAGHEGADLLRGGAGDDMLMGVTGSDTYLYASGDGNDTIREEASAGDIDTLRFDAGITASQVNLVHIGSDLLVRMADGADLRVAGQFAGYGIEKIAFADGTTLGEAEINNASWEITGSAGNDYLTGYEGADILEGKGGDDMLMGRAGGDSYLFSAGDGHDTIVEEYGGDVDTVRFAAGVAPDQVTLVRAEGDLLLRLASGDEIRVAGHYYGRSIEKIAFAGGTVWGANEIGNAAWEIAGTASADYLSGHEGVDIMLGMAGDDMLFGGAGGDTYLFTAGDGQDTIVEVPNAGETDAIRFGSGVTTSQVTLLREGGDLMVELASGDVIRVAGQFASQGIEQIAFDNGVVWGANEIAAAVDPNLVIIVGTTGIAGTV